MSYRPRDPNATTDILKPFKLPKYCPSCRKMTNNTDHGTISKAMIYMVTSEVYDDEPCLVCRWKVSPLRGALSICGSDGLAGSITISGDQG